MVIYHVECATIYTYIQPLYTAWPWGAVDLGVEASESLSRRMHGDWQVQAVESTQRDKADA